MKARKRRGPSPPTTPTPPVAQPAILSRFLPPLALCVITIIAFANSFAAGLPFDNKGLLLQDTRIREATSQNIALIFDHSYWWPKGASGLYRPVTTLSYLFNYAILGNGGHPAGYHFINLVLHLGNVLLVYALALRLIRSFWPSVFLAGLWAVHPVLTESVTNIVGRADLLAGMAVLGGFLVYLKSAEAVSAARIAWLAGLMAIAFLGVFSKESAVALLAVIALYEFTWWRNRRLPLILGLAAVAIPLLALFYQRSLVLAADPPADFPFTDNPIAGAGFWQAKLTAIKVIGYCIRLTLWPATLSADYSYNQIPLSSGAVEDWISWIVVAAALAATAALYRRSRPAFFLAAFALLNLIPTANLFFPLGTILAERFLYLPSIGMLACVVVAVHAAGRRLGMAKFAPAVLALMACGFSIRTWVRNFDWKDDVSLGTATVRASPRSFKGHQMLAEALYAADRSHGNIDALLAEAEKAVAIVSPLPDRQNTPEIYRFAGDCYLIKGDRLHDAGHSTESLLLYRKAVAVFERGASILQSLRERRNDEERARGKPPQPFRPSVNDDVYRLLSGAYLRLGEGDKAFDAAVEGRNHDPLNPAMYRQLADVLLSAGQADDAATALFQGMLVTSDMGLRQRILDLYRGGLDAKGCATVTGPNGPAINPACLQVQKNLCAAAPDAVRIRLQTGDRGLAEQLKKTFLQDYGCPVGPLEGALPQAPGVGGR